MEKEIFNTFDGSDVNTTEILFELSKYPKINEYLKQYLEIKQKDKQNLVIAKKIIQEVYTKFFPSKINYKCLNLNCNYDFSNEEYAKLCPRCKSPVEITNLDDLQFAFNFYLNRLDIYLLSGEKKTTYLIENKETNTTYIKNGNDSLQDEVFFHIRDRGINFNFLKGYLQKESNWKSLIFNYITLYYNFRKIYNLGFKPTNEKLYYDEDKLLYNVYKGNKYLNLELSVQEKEEYKNKDLQELCPNIFRLLYNLSGNDINGLKYIIKYISFILQNPHLRTEKVLSFFGEEETGKGIFYHFILNELFAGYCSFVSQKDIEDDVFNDFYSKKLIVFIDETTYNQNIEQKMLNYTTTKQMLINKKHGSKEYEYVHFNYVCASNKEVPMKVGNRRSVFFRSKTLGGNREKASKIGEELAFSIPLEILDFTKYLKSIEVSFEEINQGFENQEKMDVLMATKRLEERFIDEMKSYLSFDDFISSLDLNNHNNEDLTDLNWITKYTKDGFIEVEFLLKCFNKFRYMQNMKTPITLNKFNWFYHKLNINKENIEEFKRGYNSKNKNVYWISLNIIKNLYTKKELN